jgi:hypothetical protein
VKKESPLKSLMKNLNQEDISHDVSGLRVFIDKEMSLSKEDKKIVIDYCKLCYALLELEGDYKCYLSEDRKRAKIITTAICDFSKRNIRIYCYKRAMADILRSIAHEMFHLRQYELHLVNGKMKKHYLEPIEWQANIAAGSLLSYYAHKVGKDKIYR